jgi:hypothetical protein
LEEHITFIFGVKEQAKQETTMKQAESGSLLGSSVSLEHRSIFTEKHGVMSWEIDS